LLTYGVVQKAIDALAEPRRRDILNLVRQDELAAGAIAAHFTDVTRPAVSQHLRTLREAGLIAERRDGTRRLYRARAEGLQTLREYLDQFWDERLDALRAEAESEQRRQDVRVDAG
jgi:DNA-binding transcriptional ArsR family regulator